MGDGSGNKENKMAPLVNSRSRRDLAPPSVQANKVGCMSTLFHRLFHHPSNTRNRITNTSSSECRNQQKTTTTTNCDSPLKHTTNINMSRTSILPKKQAAAATLGGQARIIRLPGNIHVQSSEKTAKSHLRPQMMMNSASLRPPEFRQSNSPSPNRGHEQCHSPVVAKLMGLNCDITPTPVSIKMKIDIETAADEKRRKLVGALEKCDKDLQELKKMIEAMKKTANSNSSNAMGVDTDKYYYGWRRSSMSQVTHKHKEDGDQQEGTASREGVMTLPEWQLQPELISSFDMKQFDRSNFDQQPSPVSVLDASTHHLFISSTSSPVLKLDAVAATEDKHIRVMDNSRIHKPPISYAVLKAPSNSRLLMMSSPPTWRCRAWPMMQVGDWRGRWRPVSEAMRETVNEVWMEGVGRHGWQVRRVGAVVESHIFGDLLLDLLKDLLLMYHSSSSSRCAIFGKNDYNMKRYSTNYKPPFQVCRKRLSF